MESLTSSCYSMAAVVDMLGGSHSPRNAAAYVSPRSDMFLSSNHQKGTNFRFLKLAQDKRIYPVHAVVPSKTQGDLDLNMEMDMDMNMDMDMGSGEVQASHAMVPKYIHVKFELQRNCNFGEQFLMVGDDPVFGSWDPSKALPMTWSDGHVWTVEQNIPAGKSIQFKFILKRKGGEVFWQPGSDRILTTCENMNRITVCEDWENSQFQKIIEEGQPAVVAVTGTPSTNLANNNNMQPLATNIPQTQMIVAENVASSNEHIKTTTSTKTKKNMIPYNAGNSQELSHKGKFASSP